MDVASIDDHRKDSATHCPLGLSALQHAHRDRLFLFESKNTKPTQHHPLSHFHTLTLSLIPCSKRQIHDSLRAISTTSGDDPLLLHRAGLTRLGGDRTNAIPGLPGCRNRRGVGVGVVVAAVAVAVAVCRAILFFQPSNPRVPGSIGGTLSIQSSTG